MGLIKYWPKTSSQKEVSIVSRVNKVSLLIDSVILVVSMSLLTIKLFES